jgi:hypothetical protein
MMASEWPVDAPPNAAATPAAVVVPGGPSGTSGPAAPPCAGELVLDT